MITCTIPLSRMVELTIQQQQLCALAQQTESIISIITRSCTVQYCTLSLLAQIASLVQAIATTMPAMQNLVKTSSPESAVTRWQSKTMLILEVLGKLPSKRESNIADMAAVE